MAVLSSKLVISLVDQVSGPARAVRASLMGLMGLQKLGAGKIGFGQALAAEFATIRRSAAAASSTVSLLMAMVGKSGFDAAYSLEKVLNDVQSVGMLTGEQRVQLKGLIQDLNKDFPFINKEIGEAAFELLRAGFTFEQTMGSLKGTLQLAQAGDISRQMAADIATNVLTAMRLPMQTAEQAAASLQRVNDVLAYAANYSNTDVRLLGETFKYVGPMAAAAGLSIEQVAAASMIMANNGIKGSEAGVALRSALVRMAKPTKDMMATLGRLNINLGDFIKGGKAINADDIIQGLFASGVDASKSRKAIESLLKDEVLKLKPAQLTASLVDLIAKETEGAADKDVLAQAIGDIITSSGKQYDLLGFVRALREKGVGVAEIARIMDVRQGARVLTLLLGDVEAKAREVELKAKGAAAAMGDLRMQGIVGQVARLKAAWENLWVSIGDTGILREIGAAMDRIASALTSMSKSNPALLRLATYGGMALAVMGPLGLLLRGVAATMTMLGAAARIAAIAVIFLGRSLLFTLPRAGWLAMAAAIGSVGRAATVARNALVGLFMMMQVGGLRGVGALFAGGATASILRLGGAVLRLVAGFGRLVAIGSVVGAVLVAVATAALFAYNNLSGLATFFSSFGDGFMKGLGDARPVVEGVVDLLARLNDWLWRITGPLDESGKKWKSWGETAGEAVGGVVRKLVEVAQAITNMMAAIVQMGDKLSGGGVSSAGLWIAKKLGIIPDDWKPGDVVPQGALTYPQQPPPALTTTPPPKVGLDLSGPAAGPAAAAPAGLTGDLTAAQREAQGVVSAVQSSMAQARAIVASVDLTAEGQRIMESLAAGIRSGAAAVAAAMSEAMSAQVKGAVRGQFSDGAR